MLKVGTVRQLEESREVVIAIFGIEVYNDAMDMVSIMDENYGEDRDIFNDDGGYLVFLENADEKDAFIEETDSESIKEGYYEMAEKLDNEKFVREGYLFNNETMVFLYEPAELFNED